MLKLGYKSRCQTLNVWAIEELIAHYVNYCKVLGRDGRGKADDIRLYAISTRRPGTVLDLPWVTKVKPGVYDLHVLRREIRILVLRETPTEQRNTMRFLSMPRAAVAVPPLSSWGNQRENGHLNSGEPNKAIIILSI